LKGSDEEKKSVATAIVTPITHTAPAADSADKSGLFYEWQQLVRQIEAETSHGGKSDIVSKFVKTFQYVLFHGILD